MRICSEEQFVCFTNDQSIRYDVVVVDMLPSSTRVSKGHCQLIRTDVGTRASKSRSHELFVLGRQGGTRDLLPALKSVL